MFTPRKALTATVFVLLCCALLDTRWTGWLSGPVYSIVNTAQWPAGWLAATLVKHDANPRVDLPDATLEELKRELDEADRYNKELWLANKDLKDQLRTFRAIAVIQDIERIRMVEAKVSQHNDDPVNPTMKLLRGKLHGVAVDDPVVYETNLIGFVEQVGPASCTVSLITRRGYRTEIIINPPEQRRMNNNWPAFARAESDGKGAFICDLSINIADALRPGDLVSVSDTLRATANGFVLGTIASIEDHPDRPLQDKRMVIRPRAPIGPQQSVTILTERKDDD